MGIDGLNKAIKDSAPSALQLQTIQDIQKGVFGVDVSIYLYPGLYNQENKGKGSHIRKFMDMITDWRAAGHNLLMVFDGDTHGVKAKSATIAKRQHDKQKKYDEILDICDEITSEKVGTEVDLQSSRSQLELTPEIIDALGLQVETISVNDYARHLINKGGCTDEQIMKLENAVKNNITVKGSDLDDLVQLFQLTGTPFLQAAGEADHLLADLFKEGLIDGVISEDGDMLAHGVSNLIRGINDPKCRRSGVVKHYDLNELLTVWKISYQQFVDVCILAGCDYCPDKIKGIACKTGLNIIRKHGSVESYVATLSSKKLDAVPEDFMDNYREAVRIFCEGNEKIPGDCETWRTHSGVKGEQAQQLSDWLQTETNYTVPTLKKKLVVLEQALDIPRLEREGRKGREERKERKVKVQVKVRAKPVKPVEKVKEKVRVVVKVKPKMKALES